MHVIATHEVDDLERWFDSPKRAMDTLQAALAEPEAAEAERQDGVHSDTIQVFVAG